MLIQHQNVNSLVLRCNKRRLQQTTPLRTAVCNDMAWKLIAIMIICLDVIKTDSSTPIIPIPIPSPCPPVPVCCCPLLCVLGVNNILIISLIKFENYQSGR